MASRHQCLQLQDSPAAPEVLGEDGGDGAVERGARGRVGRVLRGGRRPRGLLRAGGPVAAALVALPEQAHGHWIVSR